MRLWTIQPLEVYNLIQEQDYYTCDINKSDLAQFESFIIAYNWLNERMKDKIGNPPDNIQYPVWAWHTRNWKQKKPDLREAGHGTRGTKMVCLEIEIPDDEVVLSDFDAWHFVLNNWYIGDALTSEESDEEDIWLENHSEEEQKRIIRESWEKIFDITPIQSDWLSRGQYVQATFWKLSKENIKKVQFFKAR